MSELVDDYAKPMNVGQLIEELKKYPADAKLGQYPQRWNLRDRNGGDAGFAHKVLGVEYCDDGKTVAIVTY